MHTILIPRTPAGEEREEDIRYAWQRHQSIHRAGSLPDSAPVTRAEAISILEDYDPWVLAVRRPYAAPASGDMIVPDSISIQRGRTGARARIGYPPATSVSVGDIILIVADGSTIIMRAEVVSVTSSAAGVDVTAVDAVSVLGSSRLAVSVDGAIDPRLRVWYLASRACVPFFSSVPVIGMENDDKRAGIIQTSALQAITAYFAADTVIRDDLGVVSAHPPRLHDYVITADNVLDWQLDQAIPSDYTSRDAGDIKKDNNLIGSISITYPASEYHFGRASARYTQDVASIDDWLLRSVDDSRPEYTFSARGLPPDCRLWPGDYVLVCGTIDNHNIIYTGLCLQTITHTPGNMDITGKLALFPSSAVLGPPDIIVDSVTQDAAWISSMRDRITDATVIRLPPDVSSYRLAAP